MNEFTLIKIMNEATLEVKKERNKDFEVNEEIQGKLQDEAFFFKISKEEAIDILRKTGVKEEKLEEIYNKLISPKKYYDLLQSGLINENDESLAIKYTTKRK